MDIRHEAKQQDRELLNWLKLRGIRAIAVYTKADKVSGNVRNNQARMLDAGHGVRPEDRVIFSAVTKLGRDQLIERLEDVLSAA